MQDVISERLPMLHRRYYTQVHTSSTEQTLWVSKEKEHMKLGGEGSEVARGRL